jgi:hypothetical protein
MNQVAAAVANPCPECPFNRRVRPGALGGSPVSTYVGQIVGPFALACHMHIDFQDPAWREMTAYTQTPQCAGVAVLRANIGIDRMLPAALPRAKPNHVSVFADLAEFVAHHTRLPLAGVRKALTPSVITALLDIQINRAKAKQKP